MLMLGILSLLILLSMCQEEEQEIIQSNFNDGIPLNSELGIAIKNMSLHDGSFDDLIDGGNCFSIQIPFTLIQNQQEIVIENVDELISLSEADELELKFPVTITMFDYTTRLIENKQELVSVSQRCTKQDDDIECLDFIYPLKFSTFNTITNTISNVDVQHDRDVYEFLSSLEPNTIIALQYPIQLQLYNGNNEPAGHNEQLFEIIEEFSKVCDEND